MAWAWQAHRGSANNKTASASIGVSPSTAIPVNSILVVRCASDNGGAGAGESNEHTSVTDSKGNTYTKLREHTAGGAAASSVTGSIWAARITTQLETTDTVTINFSFSPAAKVIGLEEYTVAAGKTFSNIGVAGANGSSTTPSVTLGGLPATTHLFLGHIGAEGPNGDTFTQDADYGGAGEGSNTSIGTTGGGAATNVYSRFGGNIAALASDIYNPTLGTARDWIDTLIALDEVDIPAGPVAGLRTLAMTGVGV